MLNPEKIKEGFAVDISERKDIDLDVIYDPKKDIIIIEIDQPGDDQMRLILNVEQALTVRNRLVGFFRFVKKKLN